LFGDNCHRFFVEEIYKEEKMTLDLRLKNIIEPNKIVNVHFVRSPSIFNARVLYVPNSTGDSWQLKTKEGVVYVQMFERMDLIG